jgi:hypothetical protein
MIEKSGERGQLSVLPSQYFPHRLMCVDTPAARLMHAVLEQAAHDLLHYRSAEDPHDRQVFADAYRWLISDDRSHGFSFINLCETLGYSPSAVRRSLLRATRVFFDLRPSRLGPVKASPPVQERAAIA